MNNNFELMGYVLGAAIIAVLFCGWISQRSKNPTRKREGFVDEIEARRREFFGTKTQAETDIAEYRAAQAKREQQKQTETETPIVPEAGDDADQAEWRAAFAKFKAKYPDAVKEWKREFVEDEKLQNPDNQ